MCTYLLRCWPLLSCGSYLSGSYLPTYACTGRIATAHAWSQDLAAASQEQVNDVWAGLGYYRRARLLLEGAQHVQANLSGKIPVNSVELQKIPGVPFSLSTMKFCITSKALGR